MREEEEAKNRKINTKIIHINFNCLKLKIYEPEIHFVIRNKKNWTLKRMESVKMDMKQRSGASFSIFRATMNVKTKQKLHSKQQRTHTRMIINPWVVGDDLCAMWKKRLKSTAPTTTNNKSPEKNLIEKSKFYKQ